MMKLLVPVDGSGASMRALRAAVGLARLVAGSSLHLMHAYEVPQIYDELAEHIAREDVEGLVRRDAEALLDRAEGEVQDSGVRYTREALAGPIAQTIVTYAEDVGCDAIVMGRHGKTLGEHFAGSVALKILQASKLPVMLVP
jgi:nucleotide-binding universal stress UspA family protein